MELGLYMIDAWAQLTRELIDHKMAPHAIKVGVLEYKDQNPDLKCSVRMCKDYARVLKGNSEVAAFRFFSLGISGQGMRQAWVFARPSDKRRRAHASGQGH
jgi:hypothetical protein